MYFTSLILNSTIKYDVGGGKQVFPSMELETETNRFVVLFSNNGEAVVNSYDLLLSEIDDPLYYRCKKILDDICMKHPSSVEYDCEALNETEFQIALKEKLTMFDCKASRSHCTSPLVYYNKINYIGGADELIDIAAQKYKCMDEMTKECAIELAEKASKNYMTASENTFCFLEFQINEECIGRVEIELFNGVCPKACENFAALCKGGMVVDNIALHYLNSIVHRIVPGGWIQAGDLENNGNGDGEGISIFGKNFPDESFSISHDRAGIISMANCGPHTNGSQFFITLAPLKWLDKQKVAFGKIIRGMNTVYKISKMNTEYERPIQECMISNCGIISKE